MGRKARDKKSRPTPLCAGSSGDVEVTQHAVAHARPVTTTASHSVAASPHDSGRIQVRTVIWAIALLAATAAAYAGALDTPFLLDDPINIAKNPVIQRPLSLWHLLGDPRATVTATLRWNFLQGGLDVGAYHVLNICAHAVTGLLVFALARATLRLDVFGGRYRRHADDLAGVVALIFLLHPMQTESVTYIIQRAEVFAATGLVGALLALVSMKDGPSTASMLALAAACVFGTYSKPSFVVVPALLLVYDLFLLPRGKVAEAFARRWPAYALATAAAIATIVLTALDDSSSTSSTSGFDIQGITAVDYLSAQFGVVVHYLRGALWPSDLCFDCGYRGPWPVLATVLGDSVLLPVAILVAIAAASLAVARRQPLPALAVFATAVLLAPTSSVMPLADFYVEHRMYLPIAFLALALVPTFHDLASAVSSRFSVPALWSNAVGAAVAAVVVVALAMATNQRNQLLGDPVALMEDSLAHAPQNERVHYNLANAYKKMGRLDDAIPHYEAAIRLLPNVIRSYQNLGALYLEQGKTEEALRVYLAGSAAKPEVAMGHRNVATAYLKLGQADEALAAAQKSLAIESGNPNGRRLAGDALVALGRSDEAIEQWRAGLALSPGDSALRERLAKLGQR